MKLNYREKIFLAVLIAAVILISGYLTLVKKKTQTLKDNQLKLEQLQEEREEIERKLNQIDPLKEKIMDLYNETNKLADVFVPLENIENTRSLDKFLQQYAVDNNLVVSTLEVSAPKVAELNYYYNMNDDYAESLRQAADINGDLQTQYEEENAESISLSQREVETLFQTKYGIKVNGTKEDIFNYLKAIKEYDKAILINQVNISDYSFGQDEIDKLTQEGGAVSQPQPEAPAEEVAPEEGEEPQQEEAPAEPEAEAAPEEAGPSSVQVGDKVITNTSDAQIVISLYSVYNMPKPDTDKIPSADEAAN